MNGYESASGMMNTTKGMNGMNSTKVNDIKDKVNTHMQTYIHKIMFIVGACRGVP